MDEVNFFIFIFQHQSTLLQSHDDIKNKLMTLEEWRTRVGQLISPSEVDLFYQHLNVTGCIALDKLGETQLVKLCEPGMKPVISQAEKGIFDITRTKEKLENELETVFAKQQQSENQARVALKDGQRVTVRLHQK